MQNQDSEATTKNCNSQNRLTNRTWKLAEAETKQVIAWLGECKKPQEVKSLVLSEFGKTISLSNVARIKYNSVHSAEIRRMRDEYARDIFLVDLANKRKRLEKIENIIEKSEQAGDLKLALDGLNQIKQEVEKDLSSLSLTNYNVNIYKNMTEEEIEEERVKSIERIKILKGALSCRAQERKSLENQGSN